jgi:DNA-binding beta-propeller fold protein YncE
MAQDKIIAVDKVANKLRFYDPDWRERSALDGPEPCVHELALSPDRRTAYVPLYGDGIYGANRHPNSKILVVDAVREAIADVIDLGAALLAPHGMAATRGGKLWVTCDIPNKLVCLDLASRKVDAVYDNPGKGGHLVEVMADESKLYVSAKEGALGVFDLRERRFTAAVPMARVGVTAGNGAGSEGVVPTPDGTRLIVADNDETALHIVDVAASREIGRVPLLPYVFSNPRRSRAAKLGFSPDGRVLVATSYATGLAWIIDAADLAAERPVAVAKGPMGMLFEPDGRSVVVASHDSGLFTRIDLASAKPVAAFDGGSGVEVMAWCRGE